MATRILSVKTNEIDYDEWGNPYFVREFQEREVAVFKEIDSNLAYTLLNFASYKNLGKTIDINGVNYTLDYISMHRRGFGGSRGLSVYFTVGRSVIRISDHWSKTNHHPRSRKFNCRQIDSAWWELDDKSKDTIEFSKLSAGKYPWVLKAGICGKSKLNKTVPHWKK